MGHKVLNLISGVKYAPKPSSSNGLGEDSHFVCAERNTIGVADGVGGWKKHGINSGIYARELMLNSLRAINEEPSYWLDLERVLQKSYTNSKSQGASTACIFTLRDDRCIHGINVGDSGLRVVRKTSVVYSSPVQQHSFNCPYQLGNSCTSDSPGCAQIFRFDIMEGDVIVAGTDGLFDNLYDHEIAAVVVKGTKEGLNPKEVASKLVEFANIKIHDHIWRTPFSENARKEGIQYQGGKEDDITVIVSYISVDQKLTSINAESFKICETDYMELMDKRNIMGHKVLNLISGVKYVPKPSSSNGLGEDSHFVCAERNTIGVADGVGGWKKHGINSGIYARELMLNSLRAINEEPSYWLDLERVLQKSYTNSKSQGASTACIFTLRDDWCIHGINVGDSGLRVVRKTSVVYSSPVQQHSFNCPYQLGNSCTSDSPGCAQIFRFKIMEGDVIVAGTDGLFDNLYDHEIAAVVVKGTKEGLNPKEVASKLVEFANIKIRDHIWRTPFSENARKEGMQYQGGKEDDITAIVSYIAVSTIN